MLQQPLGLSRLSPDGERKANRSVRNPCCAVGGARVLALLTEGHLGGVWTLEFEAHGDAVDIGVGAERSECPKHM